MATNAPYAEAAHRCVKMADGISPGHDRLRSTVYGCARWEYRQHYISMGLLPYRPGCDLAGMRPQNGN